ncbi:MAG: zinc-ribbon domain-containing protein [Pyrinomonadaceae bacterium]
MFCPNCGKENAADQSYCRACGLKLGGIAKVVAEILPSEENAALQRRKRILEKLGFGALSIAGLIALMSFLVAAALYKLIVFGPEVLFLASAIALGAFVMLGAGLIGYSKLFLPRAATERVDPTDEISSAHTTGKLIEDRPFEPVPSVVENTTDLLPRKSRSDQN